MRAPASGCALGSIPSLSWNFLPSSTQCPSEVDDAGLLERARRGDAEAFSLLFARCQGPIYRYAAHMCGREAADDVVQETFLAVLRGTGRYDAARGGALGYLFGIARHVVLQRLGSRWTSADPLEHDRAATIECDEPTALER